MISEISFHNSDSQTAQAFRYRGDVNCMIGHLTLLTVGLLPPVPLVPDVMVWNPDLGAMVPAIGAIKEISWGGNAWDPMTIKAWITANNRLVLTSYVASAWQISMDKDCVVMFDIYDYSTNALFGLTSGWYLAFSTGVIPIPIIGQIAVAQNVSADSGITVEGLDITIESKTVEEVQSPELHEMTIKFVPSELPQFLHFSTAPFWVTVKTWGCLDGVKAEAARRKLADDKKKFADDNKPKKAWEEKLEKERKELDKLTKEKADREDKERALKDRKKKNDEEYALLMGIEKPKDPEELKLEKEEKALARLKREKALAKRRKELESGKTSEEDDDPLAKEEKRLERVKERKDLEAELAKHKKDRPENDELADLKAQVEKEKRKTRIRDELAAGRSKSGLDEHDEELAALEAEKRSLDDAETLRRKRERLEHEDRIAKILGKRSDRGAKKKKPQDPEDVEDLRGLFGDT